jgi:hypothetical protein
MDLGGKQDLDALLKSWSAPTLAGGAPASEHDEERRWDERADAIVKAALEEKGVPGEVLAALLGSPALAPEPGENGVLLLSGEKKMTQEKEPGAPSIDDGAPSRPPASMTSPPTERKRTSLKEIAARASQSGARRSTPSTAPPSVAPSRPSTATPLPRPVEAGREDSGVINLDVVRSSVTAQQAAAADKATPGQAGLFEDDRTVESATRPAEQSVPPVPEAATVARPVKVVAISAKKSNTGAIAGAVIALLGIAAAFAIMHNRHPEASPASPVVADVRAAVTAGTGTPAPSAAPHASAEATSVTTPDPAPTSKASAGPDAKPADQARVAVGPSAPAVAGTAIASGKDAPVDPKLAAKSAPAAGPPGDLQSEMARAVGPSKDGDKSVAEAPIPEPAAGGARNQNIPEQPSQGSVQAAVGAVMSGAKGCVAGADDVSRAQVTFSSTGSVTGVSVTGWAAAHGKSGCVQAALKGAKVGPFSKSSFTVGVPIRP